MDKLKNLIEEKHNQVHEVISEITSVYQSDKVRCALTLASHEIMEEIEKLSKYKKPGMYVLIGFGIGVVLSAAVFAII